MNSRRRLLVLALFLGPALPDLLRAAPNKTPLHAQTVRGANGAGQDRAGAIELKGRLGLVVADGAGGMGGGAQAADLAVRLAFERLGSAPESLNDSWWNALFADIDRTVAAAGHGGQTTLVAAIVDGKGVRGASVGDSGAWLIGAQGCSDLTRGQARKPLIGSGEAAAKAFSHAMGAETLLLASDGLLKYGKLDAILSIARSADLRSAPKKLIDAVRLPAGTLQDDVSAILARRPR